jgi:flagellar assembly protein FliH
MNTATRFTFGTDFREGGRRAAGEAEVAAARAEGLALGREEGRRDAENQLNGLLAQLARSAERLVAHEAAHAAEVEARAAYVAIDIAVAVARKLSDALVAREPLDAIRDLVGDCFANLRSAPHLVVRVNDDLLEDARTELTKLAAERGFDGSPGHPGGAGHRARRLPHRMVQRRHHARP